MKKDISILNIFFFILFFILGFELIEENIKEDNKKIYREFIRQYFSNDKDYLKNVFKEYSDLNLKNKAKCISNYSQNLNNFYILRSDCIFMLIRS